jgi:hypothetical protein|tara:strand:- start:349 stop:621 length:273 start_codon:yes stop_codon:yes gene_type:complete
MQYQYTLDNGSHFIMSAPDMSDLLDVLQGRGKDCRDGVPVHRAEGLIRQLERGLEHIEQQIELTLQEVRERRASRGLENELAEGWEPADD